ncbi:hypothetical protein DUI87_15569 [Hirundo rustica rustica]|uniref:Uncharacterized protein n=1 Tax=Hirundo rustica rustica TaxID=333673 RepID=A0A3M0JYZ4_HIRRU|nr:hypothetical protein DUI87_15569 [Hirundo rustica rustica]
MEQEVTAEAAPALPSASPAPGSAPEAELAAAAPAGAAGQEELPEPLALQEEEKAEESPVPSEELPSLGTQSPLPAPQSSPCCSPKCLSSEIMCRDLLNVHGSGRQPQGQRHLEQCTDVEIAEAATCERQPSPGPAPQSPLSPGPAWLGVLGPQQQSPEAWSLRAEPGSDEEASDGDSPWDSSSDPDMSQGEYGSDSDTELPPGAESRAREPSQWEAAITSSTANNRLSPVMEEDEELQLCSLAGSGSPSPEGTEVTAEAAPALPSASPAPGSALEAEQAAAAPAGAAGQEERPESLEAQQEEKAAESPMCSEELPSLATQSPPSVPYNGQDSSSAWLCRDQSSSGQLLSQALLQRPAQREQSRVPGKSHMEEELSQLACEHKAELCQEVSDWEECREEETSHREDNNSQELSDWKEYLERELSKGEVKSREEVSDWEEHIGQAPSQEEASLGRDVSRGNSHGPSPHSSWEDDSDPELVQDSLQVRCDLGIWMKPLALEEDEWDELSVLELPPEEDREQKWRVFAADGLPVPAPREAWVEEQAPEPCSPGPLRAWSAALQGRASAGHVASPVQPLHGQPCAPRKRPSRFRRALRALRGLFRWPCLAPRPEE